MAERITQSAPTFLGASGGATTEFPAAIDTVDSQAHALVSQAQAGDRQAFAALYRQHVAQVHGYFAGRVRDANLREDLTADVFVKALRKIGDFRWQGIQFSAWLLRIARNTLLDHLKSAGTRMEIVGVQDVDMKKKTVPGSDLEAMERLDREALHIALSQLRPGHQEVLHLRFILGLPTSDVAKVMKKSEGGIRVLQFRALKALLGRWENLDGKTSGRVSGRVTAATSRRGNRER